MANITSDPRKWNPGMVYQSPVTGKRTTNPADVPYTPEWQARQNKATTGRMDQGPAPVVTAPAAVAAAPKAAKSSASTDVYGALAKQQAAQAAAAQAAAISSANNSARSSANTQKTALQAAIDEAAAQKGTNQSKLDALNKLVESGLQSGRDLKLTSLEADLKLLLDQAFANYDATLGDLNAGLRDNEKSESDSTFSNLANRARESQDVVTQALSQGAGESDVLKTQLQALRNWSANQGDINRSYFDTLTSTNSGITDLNVATKSNVTGYELDANQRKSSIWDDFYKGMSDSYTQMDNLATNNYLLDQEIASNQAAMSGQDALLTWLDSGKNADSFVAGTAATGQPGALRQYTGYAGQAADFAGKAWENPGVSEATKSWAGQETQEGQLNTSLVSAAPSADAPAKKKPEGATLRKW